MAPNIQITLFDLPLHRQGVVGLWNRVFGYETAHNAPDLAINNKVGVDDGLFFVAISPEKLVCGTVMCGYDGHRGWIYSLAVLPELQKSGIGTALMQHAEKELESRGCVKINLQVIEGNDKAIQFYENLGFSVERRISMGKRIDANIEHVG